MSCEGNGAMGRPDAARHARWRSARLQTALSIAVVVLIFGFLFPKLADYGAVWQMIKNMTPLERASLGAVAALSLVSYWPMLIAALPGLRIREAAVANLASTAVANTLLGAARSASRSPSGCSNHGVSQWPTRCGPGWW